MSNPIKPARPEQQTPIFSAAPVSRTRPDVARNMNLLRKDHHEPAQESALSPQF
jgi:hypothetical protein